MLDGYREPYNDPHDHTPKAEETCKKHIEEYVQREGIKGYVVGPTKFNRKDGKAFILGIVITDPEEDHPQNLHFFVTPMKALQFKPLEEDLVQIRKENIKLIGENRDYKFSIEGVNDERIPEIRGTFSFDDMFLDMK